MEIKIFCAYHPTAPRKLAPPLLKYPDIFVPILAGAARYVRREGDLFDMFVKDNEGDNLSSVNFYAGEITPIYWIYKHYKELGNPDMVGFCHYRRFLDVDPTHLDPDTIYCHRLRIIGQHKRPYACQFDNFLGIPLDDGRSGILMNDRIFSLFLDMYANALPSYRKDMEFLLNDTAFFDKNLFIMPRLEFFRYMEYALRCYRIILSKELEDKMWEMYEDRPDQFKGWQTTRCRSHFNELCTGAYLEHQRQMGVKIQPVPFTEDSFAKY